MIAAWSSHDQPDSSFETLRVDTCPLPYTIKWCGEITVELTPLFISWSLQIASYSSSPIIHLKLSNASYITEITSMPGFCKDLRWSQDNAFTTTKFMVMAHLNVSLVQLLYIDANSRMCLEHQGISCCFIPRIFRSLSLFNMYAVGNILLLLVQPRVLWQQQWRFPWWRRSTLFL